MNRPGSPFFGLASRGAGPGVNGPASRPRPLPRRGEHLYPGPHSRSPGSGRNESMNRGSSEVTVVLCPAPMGEALGAQGAGQVRPDMGLPALPASDTCCPSLRSAPPNPSPTPPPCILLYRPHCALAHRGSHTLEQTRLCVAAAGTPEARRARLRGAFVPNSGCAWRHPDLESERAGHRGSGKGGGIRGSSGPGGDGGT